MRIQITVRRPEVVTFVDAHSDNRTASVVEALKRVQRRRLAEAEAMTIGVRQAFPDAN
ncbi:hypothetical protein [Nocardia sp. NPDC049526]|uniref:hypothetical protein n=1 Tax=Nocardia sp. NPDC049526 TaxID=3364316 RepID=UPI0037B28FE7